MTVMTVTANSMNSHDLMSWNSCASCEIVCHVCKLCTNFSYKYVDSFMILSDAVLVVAFMFSCVK